MLASLERALLPGPVAGVDLLGLGEGGVGGNCTTIQGRLVSATCRIVHRGEGQTDKNKYAGDGGWGHRGLGVGRGRGGKGGR